jgi:deoxycytidylate deaminase
MKGPCAKQTVTATIIAENGDTYLSTNYCLNPQVSCPRAGLLTGEGYELCKDICRQVGHAEVNAITLAGVNAVGATLYLKGHTYACDGCKQAAKEAGIKEIVIFT